MEGRDLFVNLKDSDGHYDAHGHLAQMIALLGPPPKDLLRRERNFRKLAFTPGIFNSRGKSCKNAFEYFEGPFFDDDGKLRRLFPRLRLRRADQNFV